MSYKPKHKKLSFEDRLLFVTRNFVEYGNYGKSETRAVKVIQKYFPAYSEAKIRKLFLSYVRAFQNSIEFVERHKEYYWKQYHSRHHTSFFKNTSDEKIFFEQNKNVPEEFIKAMIYWIFDWHHVR